MGITDGSEWCTLCGEDLTGCALCGYKAPMSGMRKEYQSQIIRDIKENRELKNWNRLKWLKG